MKKLSKNGGFTIVEVLVAITIILVVLAIAIPNFNKALNNSREKADIATARSIALASEMYLMDNPDTKKTELTTSELVKEGYLQNDAKPQFKPNDNTAFKITLGNESNNYEIKVEYGGDGATQGILYPSQKTEEKTGD